MIRFFFGIVAAGLLFVAPSFGQTVGSCARGMSVGPNTPFVLFDLGSAALKPDAKAVVAEVAARAIARQATDFCIVGQTDRLGDAALNAKLAEARGRAVAAELIKNGVAAQKIVIAAKPETIENADIGKRDVSEKDRRVTILYK